MTDINEAIHSPTGQLTDADIDPIGSAAKERPRTSGEKIEHQEPARSSALQLQDRESALGAAIHALGPTNNSAEEYVAAAKTFLAFVNGEDTKGQIGEQFGGE